MGDGSCIRANRTKIANTSRKRKRKKRVLKKAVQYMEMDGFFPSLKKEIVQIAR